jgi:FMN phosphatase YigB (HAD superfamily)
VAIRSVCFDLGGVAARISYRWAEILERLGLPVPPNIKPSDPLNAMPQFDPYQAGELTDDQYFAHLAVYLGNVSLAEAKRVHAGILIEPFPGVYDIVVKLNARGIITGCLSNTNAPHWQDLAISGRFPAIVAMKVKLASHEIDASKPEPAAFEAFEKACGCAPEEILLFDDGLPNCDGAMARGWSSVHVDPMQDPAAQMRAWLSGRGLLGP